MANWETKTVRTVIGDMKEGLIALPVIQRHLEWTEDKMELLFDSLFKQYSFGSIICIEEESDSKPLFAYRLFTNDEKHGKSFYAERLNRKMYFVIDGLQRLQSFYSISTKYE